ncbi:glucosamine-6-phosphate deaminase [Candidatus Pacearchaeota archaeon]|nr:glucosamine-6-phosphate deaminase [Candidatus Pacearchaeota archaeon]
MNIHFFENKQEASYAAAFDVYTSIKNKKSIVMGLATGETMIPIYKKLISIIDKHPIDLSKITAYSLDEYLFDQPTKSFRHFLMKHFFMPLKKYGLNMGHLYFINSQNYLKYSSSISKSGGFDLVLLGIGRNGHIAFNEPGSSINSSCRIVKLKSRTIKNIQKNWKTNIVPKKAVTIGVSEILNSKKIFLAAFGKEKSIIVKRAFVDPLSSKVPASYIKKHKNVEIFLDSHSGKLIKFV